MFFILFCLFSLVQGFDIFKLKEIIKYQVDKMENKSVLYPGTYWCGNGKKPSNYNTLGPLKELDICCRFHNKCQLYIAPGGTKFNLLNTGHSKRYNCFCDRKFYNCLKDVGNKDSEIIGKIYFNVIGKPCYDRNFPSKCIKYSGYKCVDYEFNAYYKKKYQWFDVQDY